MNRIIMCLKLSTFSLLLFLFSCGGGSDSTLPRQNNFTQKYFFVAYSYNGANRIYRGLSIDANGEINFYMLDAWPEAPIDGLYTEANLDVIFNDRKMFLEAIEQNILIDKIGLISEAELGVLTPPESICFDAGLYRYAAYSFDSQTGLYREVIVYEAGDWQSINENSAAVEIRDWLIDIAIENQISYFGNCSGGFDG